MAEISWLAMFSDFGRFAKLKLKLKEKSFVVVELKRDWDRDEERSWKKMEISECLRQSWTSVWSITGLIWTDRSGRIG